MRFLQISLALLALVMVSPAKAASLVTSSSDLFCSCGGTNGPPLQPFDSSLGTLTGVTLQIDVQRIYAYVVNYTDLRIGSGSAQLAFDTQFAALVNGFTYFVPVSGAQTISFNTPVPGGPGLQQFTASGSAIFNLDPSLFNSFTGPGGSCQGRTGTGICFSGNLQSFPSFIASSTNLSFLVTDTATTSNYRLTYTFAAVPEPATWAMMLLGFALIGISLPQPRAGRAGNRIAAER